MLNITLDLDTGLAKLAAANTIKAGAQVPVTINTVRSGTPTSPGDSPAFELGLGTDAAPPVLQAYLNSFNAENAYTFTGVLNANDTRLVAAMAGAGTVNYNCEVSWTVGGELQVAPSFTVPVQSRIIPADPTSEGGPDYFTEEETLALIAAGNQADLAPAAAVGAALFAATGFFLIANRILPGAGSGAFTAAYALPVASQKTGAIAEVNVELPASANPTVEIHNATSGGTLLASVTNPAPAAAAYWYGRFRFDGTSWHCLFRSFQS
jgi:hypothetical protein